MTRALRKRHCAITISLAIVLPVLFIAALAARRAVPKQMPNPLASTNSSLR